MWRFRVVAVGGGVMNAYEIGDVVMMDKPADGDLDKCWLTWHHPMDEYDGREV